MGKFCNTLVYVAGPYTRPDPQANTERAVKVGNDLMALGYASIVPHLTHFWEQLHPQPYETWLAFDLVLLERCNVILLLPGYSSGAEKEVVYAEQRGIPVVRAKSAETAAQELHEYLISIGVAA